MIIVTAGHVDHGKSTLVRRLTGAETDRRGEEQRRGVTIDLGFSFTMLGGVRVGFVDLPGHHRYVTNMLTGATSGDMALLVVSAVEGWMPQTDEHVQILNLLGLHRGVIALSHADRVNALQVENRVAEVIAQTAGTFLEGSAIVPTAPHLPLEPLRAALAACVTTSALGVNRPRLWVDRSFVANGVGTIVTGTLRGGELRSKDRLAVVASENTEQVRIRSIEVFGQSVEVAAPGSRVGVALAGLRDLPRRGAALLRPAQWQCGRELVAAVRLARGVTRLPRSRGAFHLHVGTLHAPVRLHLLDDETGSTHLVRLVASEPIAGIAPHDRLVLRDESTDSTIAGGKLLFVGTDRPTLSVGALRLREAATDPAGLVAAAIDEAGGAAPAAAIRAIAGNIDGASVESHSSVVVCVSALRRRSAALKAEARRGSPVTLSSTALDDVVIARLANDPGFRVRGRQLWSSESEAALQDAQMLRACELLETRLAEDGGALMKLETLRRAGFGASVQGLLERASLLVICGEWATSMSRFDALRDAVVSSIGPTGSTVSELRCRLDLPRAQTIAVLERLDRDGVTRRISDRRVLR